MRKIIFVLSSIVLLLFMLNVDVFGCSCSSGSDGTVSVTTAPAAICRGGSTTITVKISGMTDHSDCNSCGNSDHGDCKYTITVPSDWTVSDATIDKINAGSSGNGTYTHTITPPADFSGSDTYKITVDSNNGYVSTDSGTSSVTTVNTSEKTITGTITVQAPPSATISGSETICFGSSAELSLQFIGAQPFTYRITGDSEDRTSNDSPTTINVSPTTSTTYSITSLSDTHRCSVPVGNMTGEAVVTVQVPDHNGNGIQSGSMVWLGREGSTWGTSGNWITYNGSTYSVASNPSTPTDGTNVYIVSYGTECVSNNPVLGGDVFANNLTIGSGRSLDLGTNTLTVAGNLTNSGTFNGGSGTLMVAGTFANTGTFNGGTGTLELAGNLSNSGTFDCDDDGNTVVFNGTSQTITNATPMNFYDVHFNQSSVGTITASNGITVNHEAKFTNGIVTCNVTFGENATISSETGHEPSISSYVNGKVTKNGMASSFCFPTGTASLYAPFKATSSSASNVSVQYAAGHDGMPDWWNHSGNLYDAGLNHASDRENWQLSASASTELSSIILYWNESDNHSFEEGNEALNSYLNVAAVKRNGFNWQNLGRASIEGDYDGSGSITAAEPLVIEISGAKAAGEGDYFVTFASSNNNLVLPIELTSFTATCDGRSSLIEWTTATEKNNDYFSIERSDDAINFMEIARVAGAGNSIEPLDYSYTDYGIHGGDNYYRLVQVDYDGTRTTSEIIVANCIESEVDEPEVLAYPNPFSGELTLVLDNFDNRAATIEVYDMLGKLIYTEKASAPQNSYETILNLSNLPSGAYNVRVSTNDFVINKNVVKN